MKRTKIFVKTILLVFVISGCSGKNKTGTEDSDTCKINIFAAAGTRLVTEEICNLFETNNHCKVERNYASSGTLARQLANGATGDIYISANKQWIDFLADKGFIVKNSVHEIAGNSLVVVAPVNKEVKAPRFTKQFDIVSAIQNKIAIGDPSYVPVGNYAKMVFDSLEWFDVMKEKIIMAKDVSSVLKYVELGECDWGVVYYSEAIQSKKVKIITKIPGSLHVPVTFYVADIKGQKAEGRELSTMFIDTTGQSVFIKNGFFIP